MKTTEVNKVNQTKCIPSFFLSFFPFQEKKTLHTAAVAQECETGMLLSYYKGGLITENNVFVFSSPALVTQCRARKPQQLCNLCTQESYQVPAIDRIACNSGTSGLHWSAAKRLKEKPEWNFTCLGADVTCQLGKYSIFWDIFNPKGKTLYGKK